MVSIATMLLYGHYLRVRSHEGAVASALEVQHADVAPRCSYGNVQPACTRADAYHAPLVIGLVLVYITVISLSSDKTYFHDT